MPSSQLGIDERSILAAAPRPRYSPQAETAKLAAFSKSRVSPCIPTALPKLVESTSHDCTGFSSVQRWHSRLVEVFDSQSFEVFG
ncbi:hypothetical protein QUA70_02505 [Microcoleus sp. LAD1_D5]|uniref:hypothetical protein n=1 Tax=Microcoleus sp. LAD1_D5 TaxID=2818813 RepID=UPI002FD2FF96